MLQMILIKQNRYIETNHEIFKSYNLNTMFNSSKDKSPRPPANVSKSDKSINSQSLPPKKLKKEEAGNTSNRSQNKSIKSESVHTPSANQNKNERHLEEYIQKLDQVNDFNLEVEDNTQNQKKNILDLMKTPKGSIENYEEDSDYNNTNLTSKIEVQGQPSELVFKQEFADLKKQSSQSSRKLHDKAKTSVKLPISISEHPKTQKELSASSRSIGGQKNNTSGVKNERQSSIDLSKQDPNDLKKIVLSEETKQTLMKLQKYDKEFSKNINNTFLKGVFDVELRRQQKIKSINRNMKALVYDNELTVGFIMNILKYQADLNKDVMQKELLIEKNKQLQTKITQINKTKNEEIKELKLSIKSKSNDDESRNKLLDIQIKELKKGNQHLVPMFRQGNHDKIRKVLQHQIKKLSGTTNKEIAFERKQLLEIILSLLNNQQKTETTKQRNTQLTTQEISKINSQISLIFNTQSSLQRNVSLLQKTKRQIESKIHDSKLFEFKDLYQNLTQGCNHMISLYQQLRDKNVQINSLNRKIADLQKAVERTERLRTESMDKGEKIIEVLKEGIEKERRKSRQIIQSVTQSTKGKNNQSVKQQEIKLPPYFDEWQQTLSTVIQKLKEEQSNWIPELTNIKKRISPKFQGSVYYSVLQNDLFLLQNIAKKFKQGEKLEKSNQEMLKRLNSYDRELDFKPSQMQKKYQVQRQKSQQLLSQKNALLKEIKQLQKQGEKGKKIEIDQVLSLNKVCYSIDSLLKAPFNLDLWNKTRSKFLNSSQFKYLQNINSTLQNLFEKALESLGQLGRNKPTKQTKLKKTVKDFIKQDNRKQTQYQEINQFLELLKQVIENELEFDRYVNLVNYVPTLLKFLSDKISHNQENANIIQILDPDSPIRNKQSQLGELDHKEGEPDKQIEELNQISDIKEAKTKQHEKEDSNIVELNQQINLELSDVVIKTNYEAQLSKLKQHYNERQIQLQTKLIAVEEKLKQQREKSYYKSKMARESEQEIDSLKTNQVRLIQRINVLNQQILDYKNREQEYFNELAFDPQTQKIEIAQTSYPTIQTSSKQQITQKQERQQQTQDIVVLEEAQFRSMNDDLKSAQQEIIVLKRELVDRQSIIKTHKDAELNFKKYITNLENHIKTQQTQQIKTHSTINENNQDAKQKEQLQLKYERLEEQNHLIKRDIHELEITLLQKDHEINNYYQLSQKYRLMFEGCCKQIEELHLNTQDEMNSLTQMHLRNQSLLEDEIQLLRKEKYNLNSQLEETAVNALEFQRIIKQEHNHLMVIASLEAERDKLCQNNNNLIEDLHSSGEQNQRLKERIIELQKQFRNSLDSNNALIQKRNPKFKGRGSHKSNTQNPASELSVKLTSLLEKQQTLSKSSLQTILGAINKLISSNKKLIERVKRTERENQALYEAFNQITQNQDETGDGISIIGHLQEVLSNLVDWLDHEMIATEEDLKLSHYFQRLQDCLSKTNYVRYIEIYQQFIQSTIVTVYEKSQQQLSLQNRQIDTLNQKMMQALDYHLHNYIESSDRQRQTDREEETEEEGEAKILSQVKVLLGIYLKTMNLKVIEDLVGILNLEDVSFG